MYFYETLKSDRVYLISGFQFVHPSTKIHETLSAVSFTKSISLISAWALQSSSTGSKLKCLVAHCRQIESEKNTAIRKKQSININQWSSRQRQWWCRVNDWAFVKLLPLGKDYFPGCALKCLNHWPNKSVKNDIVYFLLLLFYVDSLAYGIPHPWNSTLPIVCLIYPRLCSFCKMFDKLVVMTFPFSLLFLLGY